MERSKKPLKFPGTLLILLETPEFPRNLLKYPGTSLKLHGTSLRWHGTALDPPLRSLKFLEMPLTPCNAFKTPGTQLKPPGTHCNILETLWKFLERSKTLLKPAWNQWNIPGTPLGPLKFLGKPLKLYAMPPNPIINPWITSGIPWYTLIHPGTWLNAHVTPGSALKSLEHFWNAPGTTLTN